VLLLHGDDAQSVDGGAVISITVGRIDGVASCDASASAIRR